MGVTLVPVHEPSRLMRLLKGSERYRARRIALKFFESDFVPVTTREAAALLSGCFAKCLRADARAYLMGLAQDAWLDDGP